MKCLGIAAGPQKEEIHHKLLSMIVTLVREYKNRFLSALQEFARVQENSKMRSFATYQRVSATETSNGILSMPTENISTICTTGST